MLRNLSVVMAMLIVLAACGDDDAAPASTDGTTATAPTSSSAEATTTSRAPATTQATTVTDAGDRSFCEVNAEGDTLDPYRGTPAEMEADLARARELAPEFLATAPPEIDAELNIIIPIFLEVLDYVESTGFDQSAVDFGFIQSEFYGSDEAQAAGPAIDAWVDENC